MQDAHSHLDIGKAISPAILFGVAARRFAASALTPANYYTPCNPPFTLHIISIGLHKPVSVIIAGLVLLCPHARCLSVVLWAVFVALGSPDAYCSCQHYSCKRFCVLLVGVFI